MCEFEPHSELKRSDKKSRDTLDNQFPRGVRIRYAPWRNGRLRAMSITLYTAVGVDRKEKKALLLPRASFHHMWRHF
eukprot:scaffold117722_cov31-Tisochrysis_lutea.AAC.4